MTETARMYGGSLYDLAAEEGLEARILGELDEAVALFKANPDYLHLLSTPSIPKKERCGLLDEALRDQVHLYVLNFLKMNSWIIRLQIWARKVQPSSVINAWYSSISVSFRYFVKGSAYARNFMNIPGARKISSRPVTKP